MAVSKKAIIGPFLIFIVASLMLFSFNNMETGRLHYEVIRNGDVIGDLFATKSSSGGGLDYSTESTVKIKMLMTFSMYSKVTGSFRNGILVNGSAIRTVNGKARVNTTILWNVNRYVIQEDDEREEIKDNITYTTARLYHDEPVGIKLVFSENFRKFIPLKEIRAHYYELKLPDGNSNFYTYSNGVCTGAEVNTNFSKAFFRLKK
jgi:hypothetical protein